MTMPKDGTGFSASVEGFWLAVYLYGITYVFYR